MRRLVAALLFASALSTPALAARSDGERDAQRLADRLNDPGLQSSLAGAMLAMSDALMDVRVDRLRDAMRRLDPDAANDDWDGARTLGDVVARDDPNYRARIGEQSRAAVGTLGAGASAMAAMVPELQAMAERMGREVERALRRLPPARD